MPWNLQPFIDWILSDYEPSARVSGQKGWYGLRPGAAEPALYGVSDMACVLSTINALRPDESERAQWRDAFRSLKRTEEGFIVEQSPSHSRFHNTAFALAAMHLLSIRPEHPLHFAQSYATRESLHAFLEDLNWETGVYHDSHDGAGLASAMALAPESVPPEWFGWYFEWTDAVFDPANGMMGRGKPPDGDTDQVGGTFHYAFLYEYFHRPMPHPKARIDAVLGLQREDGLWDEQNRWWLTLDGLYMLTRSLPHAPHRADAVRRAARGIMDTCAARVLDPQARQGIFTEGMGAHTLTAATNLFAEAQRFLGIQEVRTDLPLRPVLDARPFI